MPEVKIKVVKAEISKNVKVKSPFVSVTFKGIVKKTTTLKGNSPVWNETLSFLLSDTPSPSDDIRFDVVDDDGMLFGIDKSLGKVVLTYNALKLSREKEVSLKGGKKASGSLLRVAMPDDKSNASGDGSGAKKASAGAGSPNAAGDAEGEDNVDEGVGDMNADSGDTHGFGGSGLGGRADRSTLSTKVEDFQIRLKIISGRQLTGSNIKPVVKVKTGSGQTKVTRIRKGSSPIWNEMMLFTFQKSLKDLYDSIVELHVNNSMKLRCDALIGHFRLDVGWIYDQPGHAFVKKWLLLTDPEDPSNTPKGYLKITICVLGAGDQPPDDRTEEEDDDVESNLLTPAGAALRPATFSLRVYCGEDFPQMDTSAFQSVKRLIGIAEEDDNSKVLVDPYLTFTFAGKKRKTRYVESTNQPEWNEELNLPVKFPSMCSTLKLAIKDWDRIGSDDAIGTINIMMDDISSTGEDATGTDIDEDAFDILDGFLPTFGPTYINFYGSPREFTEISGSLDVLNTGKGTGCAYRGRAMVELVTSLDEEGQDIKPSVESIDEDRLRSVQKYKRRRRYRLVMALTSSGQIDKMYESVEFEVSIGNYGNKFESDLGASVSTTEPQNPVFDGVRYHFMPWAAKKPVMMVTSQWEDISFRLFSLNFLLRLIDKVSIDLQRIKLMMDDKADEIEIASEIVALLDMIILETGKKLPDPRGRTASNQLDARLHSKRLQTFLLVNQEAKDLRQNCRDAEEAVVSIRDFVDRIQRIAIEPQNSFPDVIIWMICANKRIAYARIPAYDLLHCQENPEYSGRYCSKPQNIFLKYPTAKTSSKKKYKIPCQLRVFAWLGRAIDQDDFNFKTTGQIAVYAHTFEVESKNIVKGWSGDGYKDITGSYSLPKNSFSCPSGWHWEGDWKVSSDVPMIHDEGFISFKEESWEHQYRFPGSDWQDEKMLNSRSEVVTNLAAIKCLPGWEWEDEWSVDTDRGCDEEGWEYCTMVSEDQEPEYHPIEKVFHVGRRRRLVRTRICMDQKLQKFFLQGAKGTEGSFGDGWEYATTMSSQFRPESRILDMVRRRRWVRKMVTSEERGSSAIFNLDKTVKIESSEQPLSPFSFGQATGSDNAPPLDVLVSGETSQQTSGTTDRKSSVEDKSKMGIFKKKPKGGQQAGEAKRKRKKLPQLPAPKIYMMFDHVCKLHMRAYIYQARDLLPMDQDNFSDPVVMVSFLNYCRRTEVIDHTLNPVWNQTLMMDINFHGDLNFLQKFCPHVFLEVFDKDEFGNLEFMGRASGLPLLKFDPKDKERARLGWLDVRKGELAGGNILAAFEIFLKSEQQEIPPVPARHADGYWVPDGIRPKLQNTALEFLLWGVRNMEPFQLLSVNSPSILVQVGDVEVRTKIIKNFKKNPNFSEPHIYIESELPVERLYFPPIVIRVKDNRKFGRRPTVGQHIITDVSQYQVPALSHEKDQPDEGYEEPIAEEVAIEVDRPQTSKRGKVKSTLEDDVDETSPLITPQDGGAMSQADEAIAVVIEVDEDSLDGSSSSSSGGSRHGALPRLSLLGDIIKDKLTDSALEEEGPREDEIDWWSKFYASTGESEKGGVYAETGMDLVKVYKNELEKEREFNYFSDFIQTFKLFRGKAVGDDEPDYAGEFKGTFRIYTVPKDGPPPPRYFSTLPSTEPVEVKVRVYVLRAFDLAPQDSNGLADPYLKIKNGKKKINDRENYLPNTLDPTFGRMFELDARLPMDKDLYVEVFDWDLIGTDDKIGFTVIDLENRYMSSLRAWCGLPESYYISGPCPWRDQKTPTEWLDDKVRREGWDPPVWNGNTCVFVGGKTYRLDRFEKKKKQCEHWGPAEERLALYILRTFPHVPEHVETRPLYAKELPNIEQGRLQLWIDMFPKEHGEPGVPFNVEPRKPSQYELRVIVWNCSDIPMMDTSILGDQMTDIYFKGFITGLEHKRQKTDVHYRSLDGTGNFNWRMVFPFDYLPQERMVHVQKKEHFWSLDKTVTKFPPVINVQVWDNDLFGPNEYISEITLPFTNMPKCCKFRRTCKLSNTPDLQGNCDMDIVNLFDQKLLKGWWPLYRMNEEGEREMAGKLEMSVEVVSSEEVEERPAGQGRDEPNMNPKLDKPNRPATSFAWFSSPFKSLRYIIWRKYKWIILTILGIAIIIVFFVLFFYSFPYNLSQKVTDLI